MQVGENISETQREYLKRAKSADDIEIISMILERIVSDTEILAGDEDIHPDWFLVFDSNRQALLERYPEFHKNVDSFLKTVVPINAEIGEIDPGSIRIAFLLGAGASKPIPSGIPTVKELLPQLLERARRLDRDDVNALADFCDKRGISNIEDLLTAAQLATYCSRNSTVLGLMNHLLYTRGFGDGSESRLDQRLGGARKASRRYESQPPADMSSIAFLQDTLQVLFSLLSSRMLPAEPNEAHKSIVTYAKSKPLVSIVTTNYDLCMDLALGEVDKHFTYLVDFAGRSDVQSKQADCIRLIKLHGSLNWYYCEICQEVLLVDMRQLVENFRKDISPYPVIGICKECGGQRRTLLVPPLAMKFDLAPPLTFLTNEAEEAFGGADVVVAVGFSFADADRHILRMLSKSMQETSSQKLIVVDPDFQVVERMRRKFSVSIPHFDPKRILRAGTGCDEFLPKFLRGELFKADSPTTT